VRRLFILIRKSVEKYAQWVVFEPNEPSLWKKIVRSVDVFMNDLWRQGALVGGVQDEAFYVKCDDETNPPEARDAGELVCEIGLSPVKPAEFIVVRIHQWTRERTDSDKAEAEPAAAASA
jgi:phage tail sheath protein FI